MQYAGYRCQLCNSEGAPGNPLEAHHRTYENLGNEKPSDLTVLCRNCHHTVTNMLRQRKYATVVPRTADVVRLHGTQLPVVLKKVIH